MFFLGISAHLLIYLLVPAFLVIYFHFSGIQGHPEAVAFVPEKVIYEHNTKEYSRETYFYETYCQSEQNQQQDLIVFPDPSHSVVCIFAFISVISYFPFGNILRAPPFE